MYNIKGNGCFRGLWLDGYYKDITRAMAGVLYVAYLIEPKVYLHFL